MDAAQDKSGRKAQHTEIEVYELLESSFNNDAPFSEILNRFLEVGSNKEGEY